MSNNDDTNVEQLATSSFSYRYYKDSAGLLSLLLLGTICLLAMIGFYIFVQFFLQPKPLHFKLGSNLQITDPVPLDQRGISDAALLNRVNQVVKDAFSFNYSNVDQQQSKLYPYFSSAAMKIYTDLLSTDEDLNSIAANKFVVSIVPTAAPEIIVAKAFKGRFAWQIRVPARVIFSNALVRSSQNVTIDFLIWRVPETESPLGILAATFTYKIDYRSAAQGIK
jgi:hypothetical protein